LKNVFLPYYVVKLHKIKANIALASNSVRIKTPSR
jgi:hypothetical protein